MAGAFIILCKPQQVVVVVAVAAIAVLVSLQVADFGLAVKMDHMETHLSNAFQVRHSVDTQGDQGAALLC